MSKKLEKSKKDVPVKVESSGAFQELEKRMKSHFQQFGKPYAPYISMILSICIFLSS